MSGERIRSTPDSLGVAQFLDGRTDVRRNHIELVSPMFLLKTKRKRRLGGKFNNLLGTRIEAETPVFLRPANACAG